MQACNVIDLQCNVCEALVKRPDLESHQCEVAFILKMRQLKQRVAELEAENAQLKANQQQQNQPRPPAVNQPSTNKTCSAGHPMNYKTSAFPRLCNGHMGTGEGMNCDLCRNHMRP